MGAVFVRFVDFPFGHAVGDDMLGLAVGAGPYMTGQWWPRHTGRWGRCWRWWAVSRAVVRGVAVLGMGGAVSRRGTAFTAAVQDEKCVEP